MESFVTQLLAQRAETCGVEVTAMRDKATKRLLYIEAGNDFVTLLLSFLVLSVASFLKISKGLQQSKLMKKKYIQLFLDILSSTDKVVWEVRDCEGAADCSI